VRDPSAQAGVLPPVASPEAFQAGVRPPFAPTAGAAYVSHS
jgi:hypothetical protein